MREVVLNSVLIHLITEFLLSLDKLRDILYNNKGEIFLALDLFNLLNIKLIIFNELLLLFITVGAPDVIKLLILKIFECAS